jgi:hypothetical protein
MHKLVAQGTTGPAAAEHRFITVQTLFADFAMTRLNREQHRLPFSACLSDAHGTGV